MSIEESKNVEEFLAEDRGPAAKVFFSERDGSKLPSFETATTMTVIIGPKGGWEDSEIESAKRNDYSIVTLGGRIMRAETAAIALTAILQHRFGDIN
jgi:16S rRNA (uracil1498-N3)-methyltransferase